MTHMNKKNEGEFLIFNKVINRKKLSGKTLLFIQNKIKKVRKTRFERLNLKDYEIKTS